MTEASMAKPGPKFRRRKILVQPAYQLRVAATVLLCILAYSLLLGFLIFYPLQQEFQAAASSERQLWIARQVLDLHARFWPSVLLVAVLVAVQSVFVTHRIVGPAYHVQRVLEGLAAGDLGRRVHLRRWDRLKELEGAVNVLAEGLEQGTQARAAQAERLRAALPGLRHKVEGGSVSPAARQALEEVERIVGETTHAS